MTSRLADPKQHDDLLNYQLKRLVNYGGAPAVRLCEGRFGVTRAEWRVLAALVEGGACTSSQLAERAFVQRPVVSRLLAVLVRKRLARHAVAAAGSAGSAAAAGSAGRREPKRTTVEATAAGRRLYGELFPLLAQINRRLISVLDEHEAHLLELLLERLWQRARQIHDEGGGVDVRADRRRGGSRRRWEAVTGTAP